LKNSYRRLLLYPSLFAGYLYLESYYFDTNIELFCGASETIRRIKEKIPSLHEKYIQTFYLPYRFMQIIFVNRFESPPHLDTFFEKMHLPDGDVLDVEWVENEDELKKTNKIALLFTSVNGCNGCIYSRHTLRALRDSGYRVALMHYRHMYILEGDPKPNHFMSFQHTNDVDFFVKTIHERYPDAPIHLVGLSMGGNMAIRWHAKNNVKVNSNKDFRLYQRDCHCWDSTKPV